jgi:tetratricopeptide (TPR) repeat protein
MSNDGDIKESAKTEQAQGAAARITTAGWLGLLSLLAITPYLNTLANGFVQDDNHQILSNPYLRSFGHLREIFTTNVWSYVGAQGATNYYRPLMTFGYLLCYQVLGPLAYGFHLVNLLLNAGVVCLAFLLGERIFGDRALGLLSAALFALHPIHSESVNWIAAVTDLQLAFFYLLTFWLFLQVGERDGDSLSALLGRASRGWVAQVGMILSFALALLAKEPAATLPLLATFYEHFLRRDRAQTSLRQKISRYLSLWLVDLAYLLFRIRILGGLAPVVQLSHVSRREAFYSSFALLAQYAGKLVWPVHLCGFYTFHKSVGLADPRVLAGLLVLGGAAAAFICAWRRERLLCFALLWCFLNIAPVLNARWLGSNVFTERYLYLPSLGFCWIAAWGLNWLWKRPAKGSAARRCCAAGLVAVAALCVVRIVTRNRVWHDDGTFYRTTLAAQPDAIALRINLGAAYWNSGNASQAEAEWREALRRAPDHWLILNNLGLVCARQKRYDEAVEDFRRSIRLRPNYADSHMNLGRTYAELERPAEAEAQLLAAVGLAPLYVQARNELAKFYIKAGRFAEAEPQLRSSVSSGGSVFAWDSLGEIYSRWNRREDAERAFRQAVSLDAFDSHAHFGLGSVLEKEGRAAEALKEYQAGLLTDPRNAEALAALTRLKAKLQGRDSPPWLRRGQGWLVRPAIPLLG